MDDAGLRPRRSVLYMPGANERALEKAAGLPADALILDLEDAVAPDAKAAAHRARLHTASEAVLEKLGAMTDAASLAQVEEAIRGLEAVLSEGEEIAGNPAYAKELGLERKKIAGYRARIGAKRTEVELAEHRSRVESADAEVGKQLEERALGDLEG